MLLMQVDHVNSSRRDLLAEFEDALLRQRINCMSGSKLAESKEKRLQSRVQHRISELEGDYGLNFVMHPHMMYFMLWHVVVRILCFREKILASRLFIQCIQTASCSGHIFLGLEATCYTYSVSLTDALNLGLELPSTRGEDLQTKCLLELYGLKVNTRLTFFGLFCLLLYS